MTMQPTDKEIEAQALLTAMMDAPYGSDCTIGHVVCAETTRSRLEAAWLPLIVAALRTARQADPFRHAIDQELICAHLGVAHESDDKDEPETSAASGEGQQGYTIKTEVGELACSLAVASEWEKREEYIVELEQARDQQAYEGWKATQQHAGQAVPYGYVLRGPGGEQFMPASYKEFVDSAVKSAADCGLNDVTATPVYTTPQTPDGHVLVPREPTKAMLHAAFAIQLHEPDWLVKRYRAMIAASEKAGG